MTRLLVARPIVKAIMMLFALGALAVVAYLQHPLFGKLPEGERLTRITRSTNQSEGTFRNQIDTPMLTTDESQLSIILGDRFGKKGQLRPPGVVPTVKTDLKVGL